MATTFVSDIVVSIDALIGLTMLFLLAFFIIEEFKFAISSFFIDKSSLHATPILSFYGRAGNG
jgi:hypothetical protein